MNATINLLKGLHPGFFLENELKKRNISKKSFAETVNEHLQTIVSITKGKRKFTPILSLKTEDFLQLEEGFILTLQAFYEIKKSKEQLKQSTPDLTKIRSILFWDTDIHQIQWLKEKESVLKRISERGNEQEKAEIIRFYNSFN
jgi:plasmid maintenance system antidote protein VapI